MTSGSSKRIIGESPPAGRSGECAAADPDGDSDDIAAGAATRLEIIRKGYVPVLAGAVCISFSAFFVKGAPVAPSAVAFYRLLFGSAALFLVATARRSCRPTGRLGALMLFAGAFVCADLLFWHESIVLVGPGIATILTNFQVIFLALYGVAFLGERMSWPQRLSIPLALAGLVLLLGLYREKLPPGIAWGGVLGVLSAFFYACYVLTLRRTRSLPERLAPTMNIAWISFLGAVIIGVFCLASGISLAIPDLRSGLILAALGIFCQSLGWLLLSIGLPYLSPFRAGILMLIQPVLSFLWDSLFYNTVLEPWNYAGALMAVCAIGMGIHQPGGTEKG